MALSTLLAGPILRRVEPNSVSVWLAFSTAQTDVQLFIWESASVKKPTIDAASKAVKNETPSYKSAKTPTERMGQNLHIAVLTMEVTGTTPPLKPDMVYSYNVAFPDGTRDLSTEGLLNQKMIAGTTFFEGSLRGKVHPPSHWAVVAVPPFLNDHSEGIFCKQLIMSQLRLEKNILGSKFCI